MAEISKDKRAAYRHALANHPGDTVSMPRADLLALLDAADERDRLREAARDFCDKLYQESGATYELNPAALERLEALL